MLILFDCTADCLQAAKNCVFETYESAATGSGQELDMSEKIYTTMKSVGVGNLVIGILLIITGIASGVLVIVNGARLLRKKSEILF